MRGPAGWRWWLFGLLFFCGVPVAQAASGPRPVVVMLAARDAPTYSREAISALGSQLADLPVRLHVVWVKRLEPLLPSQVRMARLVAARQRAVAVVWADLTVPDQLFVYLAEPGGGRILVRNLESEGRGRSGRIEAMALVVRSAVRAMLDGARIGVGHPRPSGHAAVARRPKILQVSGSYALLTLGGKEPVLHGARFAVEVRALGWLRAFVAYRLVLPVTFENTLAAMQLAPHPVEAGVVFSWRMGRWRLEGGGGIVLDYQTWSLVPKQSGVEDTPPYGRLEVSVFPCLSANFRPIPWIVLFVTLGLDISLNRRRFVVKDGPEERILASPWRARPWFLMGVAFPVF